MSTVPEGLGDAGSIAGLRCRESINSNVYYCGSKEYPEQRGKIKLETLAMRLQMHYDQQEILLNLIAVSFREIQR